jgi:hypothetical protein
LVNVAQNILITGEEQQKILVMRCSMLFEHLARSLLSLLARANTKPPFTYETILRILNEFTEAVANDINLLM